MAAKDNLIPVRSKEEASERGRNGGIASGKARRAKKIAAKTYNDAMKKLLGQPYKTELSTNEVKATCQAFGLDSTQSGAIALAFSDFFRALQGDEESMQRILKATSSLGGAVEESGAFESTQIVVLPAAKPGENVDAAAEEADGESP